MGIQFKDRKRILPIIILTVVAAATAISISYHAPTSNSLRNIISTKAVEEGKTVSTNSYITESGNAIIAADKGYAAVRTTKDADGKTILEEYLDENGNLILLSSGYAAVSYEYTDGLATTIHYLDEKKESRGDQVGV